VIRTTPDATRRALVARGAPYEYWYVKAVAGDLAILVDFIVRRARRSAEIRLSYWVRGKNVVAHDVRDSWQVDATRVRIGDGQWDEGTSRGTSSGVTWDLRFTPGRAWLAPGRIGGMLRAFDSQIVLSPGSRVSGSVDAGGERFHFNDAPGVLTHYWSVKLPPRWLWLSANTTAGDVEALVASQRLWRLPWPRLPIAYAFVSDAGGEQYVISPLTGLVRASGTRDAVRVTARRWGRAPFEITASRDGASVNDIGEGITQTLVASGRTAARSFDGVMGLETRGWP